MLSDKALTFTLLAFCALMLFWACTNREQKEPELESEDAPIAKGADISWITEMEHKGYSIKNKAGEIVDCFQLMADLGMNAIRLRVWVNPVDGWCNRKDVVAKARRADALGLDVMIDFHYSDWWADPGKQNKPAAWKDMTLGELKNALAKHTRDVLENLRNHNIEPKWIQIGNETSNGMLWPTGKASESMSNYALLHRAGYDAAKSVFPNSYIMVHIDRGEELNHLKWILDGLQSNGAKWDMIGVSLYPAKDSWQSHADACIYNLEQLVKTYDTPTMICEVGMHYTEAEACKKFIQYLFYKGDAMNTTAKKRVFHGVFYWEPQSSGDWNHYSKGAFSLQHQPTVALEAFSAK